MAIGGNDACCNADWNEYVSFCESLPGLTTDGHNEYFYLNRVIDCHNFCGDRASH
jgi:hypothetical protein